MNHRIIRKEVPVAMLALSLLGICVLLVATGCCAPSDGVGDNRITGYSIGDSVGAINHETNNIVIGIPEDKNLNELVAEFSVRDGATVTVGNVVQISGVTANDFRFPVVYMVSSDDGPTEIYVVNVVTDGVSANAGSQNSGVVPWFGAAGLMLLIVAGAIIFARRTESNGKN